MFDAGLKQLQDGLAALGARLVAAVDGVRLEVRELTTRATRGQLADPDNCAPFMADGSASIAAGANAVVLSYTPPKNMQSVVRYLANEVVQPDRWATGDPPTGGVYFCVKRAGMPMPGLDHLRSPYGRIGARQRVETIKLNEGEVLTVVAYNLHATDTIDVCAQVSGFAYTSKLGTGLEGVGAQLAKGGA